MIDNAWCGALPAANDAASSQAPVFGSYRPGELVKQCLRMPTMVVPTQLDERSTTASQSPRGAVAQVVTRTSLAASNDQDSNLSICQASPELPSLGSLGHYYGLCRPCGFLHSRSGCDAGASCTFCHLCPPGTIQLQRKMKGHLVRAAQRNRSNRSKPGSCISGASSSDGSAMPPDHDAASQCSTADTQSTGAESPRLVVAKSMNKVAVDVPTTGCMSLSGRQKNGTITAGADCISCHDSERGFSESPKPPGPSHVETSATNSAVAAASAKTAASRVVALLKRRNAQECLRSPSVCTEPQKPRLL